PFGPVLLLLSELSAIHAVAQAGPISDYVRTLALSWVSLAKDSAGTLRTAPHANSDAARQLPRLTTHSAGAIATGVTPSHTLAQELQLRASISAVRQLQLQVLRGVRFRASFVPTRRGKVDNCAEAVVAVDGVSPRRPCQHTMRTMLADALA